MKLLPTILRRTGLKITYLTRKTVTLSHDGRAATTAPEEQEGRRLVILGKQAYHETVQSLPITDIKEIKAAVAIDPTAYAPFATDLFFMRRIGRKQERTLVNLWFVRPEAIQNHRLDRCWLTIPETALWSLPAEPRPRLDLIQQEEDRLMVHVDSAGGVRSTLATGTDEAVDNFRRGLGPEGCQCPVKHVASQREYFQSLVLCLKDASLADLAPFIRWRFDRRKFFTPSLRRAVAGLTAMLMVYLALWLGLPFWAARRLTRENKQLAAGIGEVLDRQEQLDAIQKEIRILAKPMENTIPKLAVLDMLYDTLARQAVISRLTMAANRVEIHGNSDQASAVIGALTAVPGLTQVQLMAPLRKHPRSGKDLFTISFLVQKEPFLNYMEKNRS